MTPMQKQAWFTLGVIALTVVSVLALYPLLGSGALGGFGLLGLQALARPLFYRRRPGQVLTDERDHQIGRRSLLAATTAAWAAFLGVAILVPFYCGPHGAVPVLVLEVILWGGTTLFFAVQALTILVEYTREG